VTAIAASRNWFEPSHANRLAQFEAGRNAPLSSQYRPVTEIVDILRHGLTSIALQVISTGQAVLLPFVEDAASQLQVVRSTHDLVVELREAGMPISAIAELVGVQRKTVYSWLNDRIVADPCNHDRLSEIAALLRDEPSGSLRFLPRHWDRQLPEGMGTLKDILKSDPVDKLLARDALNALRPAILRSCHQNQSLQIITSSSHPASSLTEYLHAVTE